MKVKIWVKIEIWVKIKIWGKGRNLGQGHNLGQGQYLGQGHGCGQGASVFARGRCWRLYRINSLIYTGPWEQAIKSSKQAGQVKTKDLKMKNHSDTWNRPRNVLFTGNICVEQGSSISGPRAKSGPWRPNDWPVEQCQNAEEFITFSFKSIFLYWQFIYLYLLLMTYWF